MMPLHTETVKYRSTGKDNSAAANDKKKKSIEKLGNEIDKPLDEKTVKQTTKNSKFKILGKSSKGRTQKRPLHLNTTDDDSFAFARKKKKDPFFSGLDNLRKISAEQTKYEKHRNVSAASKA